MIKEILRFIWHLPRRMVAGFVYGYQKILSPDHSAWGKSFFPQGYCKYHPTCSEYTRLALKKNGLIVGTFKGIWRILRCNPWSHGGEDWPN